MSTPVVIDTSIVIKWVVEESDSAAAIALLIKWSNEEIPIIAPTLLAYEVANVFHQRVRKGSMTAGEAEQTITYLLQNVLEIDETKDAAFNVRAMQLAKLYGLPAVYDAHYLVLAERKGYEFWTADSRLLKAIKGKLPWIHTLDEAL